MLVLGFRVNPMAGFRVRVRVTVSFRSSPRFMVRFKLIVSVRPRVIVCVRCGV